MNIEAEDAFTKIYDEENWKSKDGEGGLDGQGSRLDYTKKFREELPKFLSKWKIKSILDASCGEFIWMRHVDLKGIKYIGGDIVREKIDVLKEDFPDKEWHHLDIITDPLPKADLWFCRDTLFHFPEKYVRLALENFLASDIKYILTSTHPEQPRTKDLLNFGAFSVINLQDEVFDFPDPLDSMLDSPRGALHRKMFLYKREDMKKFDYFND